MNLLPVLRDARKLLEDPEHWVKGEMAQDAHGKPAFVGGWRASKFCLAGALAQANHRLNNGRITQSHVDAATVLIKLAGSVSLTGWADQTKRTHAEVLALLDRAIAQQEAAAALKEAGP